MLRISTKHIVVSYLFVTFFLYFNMFSMDTNPDANVNNGCTCCTSKRKRKASIKQILDDVDKAFESRVKAPQRKIFIDDLLVTEAEYISKLLNEYENKSVSQILEEETKEEHLENLSFDMLLKARDKAIKKLYEDDE